MSRRVHVALAVALLAAAGCNSSGGTQTLGLQRTSAVAVFHGYTAKRAELHPYYAVTNPGRQELILVDAVNDEPVLAPVLLQALAVPVDESNPALLVSASLGDDAGAPPVRRPDLLVVASSGSSVLQVVRTWAIAAAAGATPFAAPGIAFTVDLADLGAPAGARVLSLAAAIATDAGGAPIPGRVRIVAGLSAGAGPSGGLAAVDFERAGTATEPDLVRPVEGGGGWREIGFDPVSLAVPYDPLARRPADAPATALYAASPDPIQALAAGAAPVVGAGTPGVARIAAVGPIAGWTVTPMDVRGAPSRLVAAWRLFERKVLPAAVPPAPRDEFEAGAVDRVYVVPDESGCGTQARIDCNVVAVLDPAAGGLAADPAGGVAAGGMPYLAPIPVPGRPVGLAVAPPPVVRPAETGDDAIYVDPLMKLEAGSLSRATTAVLAVTADDGRLYPVDLARWAIPSTRSPLRGGVSETGRAGAIRIASAAAATAGRATLGVVVGDAVLPAPGTTSTDATLRSAVRLTPGFGPPTNDSWQVEYQGALPGFAVGRRTVGGTDGGGTWVALQNRAGGEVVRTHDPGFGIALGDRLVVVNPTAIAECAVDGDTPVRPELEITGFVSPSPEHRGGAFRVATATAGAQQCLDVIASPTAGPVFTTIVASGYRIVSAALGYAGRPVPGVPFELRYENEDDAALDCPIRDWVEDLDFAAPSPAEQALIACTDAACRARCDRWVLARKARRTTYVSERCRPGDSTDQACLDAWAGTAFASGDPNANGPVIAFTLGVHPPTPPQTDPTPERGASLNLVTSSGLSRTSRVPASGFPASGPVGVAPFDRSPFVPGDMYRFFVAYPAGFVLDTSPGVAGAGAVVR